MTRYAKLRLFLRGMRSVVDIYPAQSRQPLRGVRKSACRNLRKDWKAICEDGRRIAQDMSKVIGK